MGNVKKEKDKEKIMMTNGDGASVDGRRRYHCHTKLLLLWLLPLLKATMKAMINDDGN